jgi:hypothetical protein
MRNTVAQILSQISDQFARMAVSTLIRTVADRMSSQALTSAGLVIKAASSTLAKTGASATYVTANGRVQKIAAATDMPALTGITITANKFNVVCFFIDSAGTVTAVAGQEATTRDAVVFPQFPEKKGLVGLLIITHSSTFTGGTTALDTATTEFISPTGPFDPSMVLG